MVSPEINGPRSAHAACFSLKSHRATVLSQPPESRRFKLSGWYFKQNILFDGP